MIILITKPRIFIIYQVILMIKKIMKNEYPVRVNFGSAKAERHETRSERRSANEVGIKGVIPRCGAEPHETARSAVSWGGAEHRVRCVD